MVSGDRRVTALRADGLVVERSRILKNPISGRGQRVQSILEADFPWQVLACAQPFEIGCHSVVDAADIEMLARMGGVLSDGLYRPHGGHVHEWDAAEVEYQRDVLRGTDSFTYVVAQISGGTKTEWPTKIKVG